MVAYMAPTVEIRHDPPVAFDTSHPREMLAEHRSNEIEALSRALTNYQEIAIVSARENEVVVQKTVSGSLANGDEISASYQLIYTIRGGQIVAAFGDVSSDAAASLGRALKAGGFVVTTT
jgi:hypothetical protein